MDAPEGFEVFRDIEYAAVLPARSTKLPQSPGSTEWVPIHELPEYQGRLFTLAPDLAEIDDVTDEQYKAAYDRVALLMHKPDAVRLSSINEETRRRTITRYMAQNFGRAYMPTNWPSYDTLYCSLDPHEFDAKPESRKLFGATAVKMCASCPLQNKCLTQTLQENVDLIKPDTLSSGGLYPKDIQLINRAILYGAEPEVVRTLINGGRLRARIIQGLVRGVTEFVETADIPDNPDEVSSEFEVA